MTHSDVLSKRRSGKGRVGFIHRSLQVQSTAWLMMIAFGTYVMVFMLIWFYIYKNEENTWRERQAEAAQNAAFRVESFLNRVADDLLLVSSPDEEYILQNPSLLTNLLEQNPAILEVVRVDKNGKVIAAASQETPVLQNQFTIRQAKWFLDGLNSQTYQGTPRLSAMDEPYLIVSTPATGDQVVAARIRMIVLEQVVQEIRFGKNGSAYVVSDGGEIIAHTQWAVIQNRTTLEDRPEFKTIQAAPDYSWHGRYINFQGQNVVASSSRVLNTNWIVITELPQVEAYTSTRVTSLFLGGGLLLVTGIITILIFTRLRDLVFDPLGKLRVGAERVGSGDLSYRLEPLDSHEFGQVANAFNQMAENLMQRELQLRSQSQELVDEIRHRKEIAAELQLLNLELEDRVHSRTNELVQEIAERKVVEDELRASLERIMLFNRVISAGTETMEPGKILENLCTELALSLNIPQVEFALVDEEDYTFGVIAEYREPNRVSALGYQGRVTTPDITDALFYRQKPYWIRDFAALDVYPGYLNVFPDLDLVSILLVPLILREKLVGVIALGAVTQRAFTSDEISLVQNLTTAAGQVFENARLYANVQRELAERLEIELRLMYQSTHDSLTDLYNRLYFEEEMKRLEFSRLFPITIIMLDLDQLKEINDTHGHALGDEYLRLAAMVLKSVFRVEDVVARLGGDEFAVLLTQINAQGAGEVTQRLREAFQTRGSSMPAGPLQVSIGWATGEPGEPLAEVLKRADGNMYREKANKKTIR